MKSESDEWIPSTNALLSEGISCSSCSVPTEKSGHVFQTLFTGGLFSKMLLQQERAFLSFVMALSTIIIFLSKHSRFEDCLLLAIKPPEALMLHTDTTSHGNATSLSA